MSKLPALGRRGEGWLAGQFLLFALILYGAAYRDAWLGSPRDASVFVGLLLLAFGGFLALRGVQDLRENLTAFPAPVADGRLIDTGAYAIVRHPIYTGLIMGALGWGLALAAPVSLAGAVALGVFFDLKSRREEVWLAERYPGYEDYRRRTRKLIPWVY